MYRCITPCLTTLIGVMPNYSPKNIACQMAVFIFHVSEVGCQVLLMAEPPKHTNRLAQEKSPYLLQQAHNPVDWFAWNDEAFARARAQSKPIFLSIGYSTCHW